MKFGGLAFVLCVACISLLSAQDYMQQYSQGSLAIGLGNCYEGEPLIQESIKANPKDDFRRNYFPHYYLAVCAMSRGELEAAQKLAKQAEGSGISFSSLAREYSKFKSQLQAKLKEPKQQKQVLAVVVNTENSISDISLEDLRKIYKGEKKTWDDGKAILPVLGPEGSQENRAFLSTVCSLDEKGLKAVWDEQKIAPPPKIEKNEWILRFVFSNPGAIAFYPNSGSLQQVKVIRIDGKDPSDPDYPFAAP